MVPALGTLRRARDEGERKEEEKEEREEEEEEEKSQVGCCLAGFRAVVEGNRTLPRQL